MRLSRFFIASLFIFFFAFGTQTQVFAQVPPNCVPKSNPTDPEYNLYIACTQGGAGAFYGNLATCQRVTCSAAYTPGAFAKNVPIEKTDQDKANAATYANGTTSQQSFVFMPPALVNGSPQFKGSILTSVEAGLLTSLTQSSGTGGSTQVFVKPNGEQVTVTFGNGVIGSLSTLTAQMIGKPQISSVEYVADLMNTIQNPLGAQPAYAQGLGFSSLAPALTLWKIFRNIAYFFFVIIFLVIGFMIMFRSKIGGQAAVTIQQALPKIIVSLLLVTFSYAIAGLLIDVMYLIIYLIIGIFTPFFAGGVAGGSMFGGDSLTKVAFQNNIVQNTLGLITNGAVGNVAGALGNITVGALGLSPDQLGGQALQGFANITFTLILAIVVLVSIFKVFLALLQAYVFIFFSVIFAPLQLLLGAIPGQNTFGKWVRGLLENLLVFPTIILMIFIAYFFTGPFGAQTGVGQNLGFSAPQLTSNQGAQGFSVYQSLIALGAILAMPEVLKVTKGLMKGEVGVGVNDLLNTAKGGVPLGSRIALGGGLALGAGALATGRDLVSSATGPNRRVDWRGALERGRVAALGGIDPRTNEKVKGAIGRGISASSFISSSIGANQPNILNPVTSAIDKKFNPDVKKREEFLQELEDAAARIRGTNRGTGGGGGTP